MKTKTKVLGLMMAAVLLVTATIFGTVAYLTSAKEVTNTFTVGAVDIMLDEAKVGEDGKALESGERWAEGNTYKLMPGHTYDKDPTVTVVMGSESSYVRMLVTISKASAVKEVFGDDFLPENYVTGWNKATWIPSGISENLEKDTITYEFRYKETVAAPADDMVLDDLFESFTVPGEEVNNEDLAKLQDMTITVVAHAIQADGFDTADKAWAAFPAN